MRTASPLPHRYTPTAPSDPARQPWNAWLLLALYFGAQVLCRVVVSPALELDEAEQALWAQQLHWGYGAQPPLYTWLQWGMFQLFGASVLSLSLLKNLLLASTYAFVFLAGRLLMPASWAALASASMLLLPQIGWESSRDLTHSVLLTTIAAATLYLTLALLERPRPALYLLLGAATGLGFLAKYSYGLFLLALLLAVLTGRDTRSVLRSPWLLGAVLVTLLIVTPHGLWLQAHWQLASEDTLGKLARDPSPGWAIDLARGLLSLLLSIAGFLWPWALATGWLFGRAWRGRDASRVAAKGRSWDHVALWRRYLGLLVLMFLAMVLFGEVTHFKDRWMQPVLFCVPLIVFSCIAPWVPRAPQLRLRRILLMVAVLVLVLLTLRPHYHAWRNRPNQLNLPTQALVQSLRDAGFTGEGTILSQDRALAGSLRLQFPAARVEIVETAAPAVWQSRPLLAIDSLARPGQAPGAVDTASRQADAPAAVELALPYRRARVGAPPMRFRYLLLR